MISWIKIRNILQNLHSVTMMVDKLYTHQHVCILCTIFNRVGIKKV